MEIYKRRYCKEHSNIKKTQILLMDEIVKDCKPQSNTKICEDRCMCQLCSFQ